MDFKIDQHRFEELTAQHRYELTVHCYHMLGSLQESEDLVQETMLRAWRHLHTYREQGSFKAWMYRIATNVCLDALKKRKEREPPTVPLPDAGPLQSEPPLALEKVWLEPMPSTWLDKTKANPETQYQLRESVRLAFMVALQTLPPKQRAVLILCDVLAWRAQETADLLEISLSAVNSALHRARAKLRKSHEEIGNPSQLSGDESVAQLFDRFVRAWETANMAELVTLLREDVVFTMPPATIWYKGISSVQTLLTTVLFASQSPNQWRLLPTSANDQPAFGLYMLDPDSGKFQPHSIQVLTIEKEKVADATHFLYPHYFARFGLPAFLAV